MHTFLHPLRRGVRIARGRDALVLGDRRVSYADLDARLRRLHTVLRELGTEPGDRVAVLALNSIAFVELYLGISTAGRVQVPLNFRWATPELEYALADSGATNLVTDRDPGPLAALVRRVVRIDTGEYDEMLESADATPFEEDAVDEHDLAGLFYTGGTTGASKGVMLTHRNLIANALHTQTVTPLERDDVYLVMAPLFHAAGSISVLQALYAGASQVIVPAFDAGEVLETIERERVTMTLGVPTMVAAMVEEQLARPRDVSSLRVFSHGGSPIAIDVVRRSVDAFPGTELVHLYGTTETSPLATGLRHEELLVGTEREKSAGQAMIGIDVVVRDESGAPLPDGEPGEVTIRGANVMRGYWNKPEQTAAAIRHGWYWTGDVGRFDSEGFLFLLDRSKDMIISGGENVYCTEVEDALYSHPAVLEATVFGIPHEQWGEAVHAVVVARSAVTEAEIIAHCRERIAGYKVPRSVSFQDEPLPKSGPGKVLKRELRAPFWEGRDSAIG